MSAWQPIETAPKDGTKVDLLFPYPRGRTIDCFWADRPLFGENWYWLQPSFGPGGVRPECQWTVNCHFSMQPTHWMLPPELPSESTSRLVALVGWSGAWGAWTWSFIAHGDLYGLAASLAIPWLVFYFAPRSRREKST